MGVRTRERLKEDELKLRGHPGKPLKATFRDERTPKITLPLQRGNPRKGFQH